jgi:hypothetical protein
MGLRLHCTDWTGWKLGSIYLCVCCMFIYIYMNEYIYVYEYIYVCIYICINRGSVGTNVPCYIIIKSFEPVMQKV